MIDLGKVETDVTKSLELDTDHPYGQRSMFVRLEDGFGVKMYTDREERDECMTRQAEASEHSLGPTVHGSLDLPSGKFRFGYVSQVAILVGAGSWFDDLLEYERNEQMLVLVNELRRQTGFCFTDTSYNNVGIVNGTDLVCIDFGEMDGMKSATYEDDCCCSNCVVECSDDYSDPGTW